MRAVAGKSDEVPHQHCAGDISCTTPLRSRLSRLLQTCERVLNRARKASGSLTVAARLAYSPAFLQIYHFHIAHPIELSGLWTRLDTLVLTQWGIGGLQSGRPLFVFAQ